MKALIYSRISDDPTGRAAGVERQADECRALAKSVGATVLEEIVDNDLSATSGKRRPGYEQVLQMVRDRTVDTIIVWHTDRLYRLPRDLEPIIDLAEDRKLRFFTVTASEIDLNTASGRMVARLLAAVSAQEVEHKAERQRSASNQRASDGMPTIRPGYGYRRVKGRDVVDPFEAFIVKEIADRILSGVSIRSIAKDLNDRGVPSPSKTAFNLAVESGIRLPRTGAPWSTATVRQMVRRPSLAGQRTHRGSVVGAFDEDLHPAILSLETHQRLNAMFDDPSRTGRTGGRSPKYLLSGIAECGLCGARMMRTPPSIPKPGEKRKPSTASYACVTCFKIRRKQDPVDELIEAIILARLKQDDAIGLFAQSDPESAKLAKDEMAVIDARLAMAADQFAEGAITGEQLRRITEKLRTARSKAESTLTAALPPQFPEGLTGAQSQEVWGTLDMDTKRAVLQLLIEVVILPATKAGRNSFDPETVQVTWITGAK